MRPCARTLSAAFVAGFVFVASAPLARAQVAVLGKGWMLDGVGTITSAPAEVISGRSSIKGSYDGADTFTGLLLTDPTFVQFARDETYTITLNYRVLAAGSRPFSFGFFSPLGSNARNFIQTGSIRGGTGSSGSETLRVRLGPYDDYGIAIKIDGTGSVVVDDIRVTDEAGRLIASEDAEGPSLARSPLTFQIADAFVTRPEKGRDTTAHSVAASDLDGDGYPEMLLTLSESFTASTTLLRPLIVEASSRMRIVTDEFFPGGAPTVGNSPVTLFVDINHDGLSDILLAEAGNDAPPGRERPAEVTPGIGIALNLGRGKFRNVSSLVPEELRKTYAYALAAGDLDADGRVEILLPDEPRPGRDGSLTSLLRWNGDGFDAQRNWISQSLWRGQVDLANHSAMVIADLDVDGRQDLLVSGTASGLSTPNLRILFGAAGGFTSAGLLELPDGPFGHQPPGPRPPVWQAADVQPLVVADFNNDGLPDIFATEEQVLQYAPGIYDDTKSPIYSFIRANGGAVYSEMAFQVFINRGSRRFVDVTATSSQQMLGMRYYSSLVAKDMNNDGFMDVVGMYLTRHYDGARSMWATTFFLNDGAGAFQVVDGAQLLGVTTTPSNGKVWNLGAFVPTLVNRQRTEGIVYESLGGCGGRVFCGSPTLNLFKVVANGALGTGPNFADSTLLGVPGFNEFYYLRMHPEVAAAVQRGEYRSGLDYYLAHGRDQGHAIHAPNATIQ